MAFGVVLFLSIETQGSVSSARQTGCLRFSFLHPVPPRDITPRRQRAARPSPPSTGWGREEAKSPRLQERGSQKGKLKGAVHVPCPLCAGSVTRWMSAWLVLCQDPQQDEAPLAGSLPPGANPRRSPKLNPSLHPLTALFAGPRRAALGHGAAFTGGSRQACASMATEGAEITEEVKKIKKKKSRLC